MAISIKDLIDSFIAGAETGHTGSRSCPGNLKISENKLIHYNTVIAERVDSQLYVNLSQYSVQTGYVQKQLKEALSGKDYIVVKKVNRDYNGSLKAFEEGLDLSKTKS